MSGLDKALKTLIEELNRINKKLDKMIEQNERILNLKRNFSVQKDYKFTPDALALLSLPTSFRKTMVALYKLGEATAEDIAKETNRMRSVESGHANYLVRLGYVKKRRKGRKVYFYIEQNQGSEL